MNQRFKVSTSSRSRFLSKQWALWVESGLAERLQLARSGHQKLTRRRHPDKNMLTLKITMLIFASVVGIQNQIIDYKHSKRKAYKYGNARAYYTKLSRESNWDGRFMMWSVELRISLIIATLASTFYALSS
jgi:hypothetical protein